jgi:SAM-dependent methyltransferase
VADEGPLGWAAPLHARVLDATGTGTGTRVLDLGCGAGAFARAAADRGALVRGVDADRAAVARAAAAVPEGEFHVGDAHDAAAHGTADVVAAVQVLAHVANPLKVLRSAAAATVPGGLVAVTVWGREAECDVRLFGEALSPWLPPRPPQSGPAPVTEPDRLRRLAELAGLEVVLLDEVVCPFTYPDEDALVVPVLDAGIGRLAARRTGPAQVRAAVLERFAGRRTPDGGYRLDNLFRVLVARPAPCR